MGQEGFSYMSTSHLGALGSSAPPQTSLSPHLQCRCGRRGGLSQHWGSGHYWLTAAEGLVVANVPKWATAAAGWAQPLGTWRGIRRAWQLWAGISIPRASPASLAACLPPPPTGPMPGATAALSSDIYQLGREISVGLRLAHFIRAGPAPLGRSAQAKY